MRLRLGLPFEDRGRKPENLREDGSKKVKYKRQYKVEFRDRKTNQLTHEVFDGFEEFDAYMDAHEHEVEVASIDVSNVPDFS